MSEIESCEVNDNVCERVGSDYYECPCDDSLCCTKDYPRCVVDDTGSHYCESLDDEAANAVVIAAIVISIVVAICLFIFCLWSFGALQRARCYKRVHPIDDDDEETQSLNRSDISFDAAKDLNQTSSTFSESQRIVPASALPDTPSMSRTRAEYLAQAGGGVYLPSPVRNPPARAVLTGTSGTALDFSRTPGKSTGILRET